MTIELRNRMEAIEFELTTPATDQEIPEMVWALCVQYRDDLPEKDLETLSEAYIEDLRGFSLPVIKSAIRQFRDSNPPRMARSGELREFAKERVSRLEGELAGLRPAHSKSRSSVRQVAPIDFGERTLPFPKEEEIERLVEIRRLIKEQNPGFFMSHFARTKIQGSVLITQTVDDLESLRATARDFLVKLGVTRLKAERSDAEFPL